MNTEPANMSIRRQWFSLVLSVIAAAAISFLVVSCQSPEAKPPATATAKGIVRGYLATQVGEGSQFAPGAFPLRQVYLPGIKVFLRNIVTNTNSDAVLTDLSGRFNFPPQPDGRYQICWSSPGFRADCNKDVFSIQGRPIYLSVIDIPPERKKGTTVVTGRVRMSDGSRPRVFEPMANVNAFARVVLLDEGGSKLAVTPVNNFGDYLVPQVPGGKKITLRVEYEGAAFDRPIFPEASLAAVPSQLINLRIRNHPPRLRPIVAKNTSGQPVKASSPGDTVTLEARSEDPDGDPLKFRWLVADGSGSVSDLTAPTVTWTLPGKPGQYAVTLIAYDGKGGYARSRLSMRADGRGIGFSGFVDATDAAAVPNATVDINGKITKANSQGYFRIFVEDADNFILNIRAPGYGLMSKIYQDGVEGGRWTLTRASVHTVDPTRPIDVVNKRKERDCPGPKSDRLDWKTYAHLLKPVWQDGKGNVVAPFSKDPLPLRKLRGDDQQRVCPPGIRVQIPANSLTDKEGNPPIGNVQIELSTVDLSSPEQMPGDYTVRLPSAETRVMQSYAAATVEITDGTKVYDLKPGAKATVRLPADPSQLATGAPLPPTIPLLFYEETKGEWIPEGSATLQGSEYVADITHLSEINTDLVKEDQSCVSVLSEELEDNYILEVTIPFLDGTAPKMITKNIDNSAPSEHVVYNLPQDTNIVLVPIRPSNNVPYGIFVVNTGGAQNPTDPNRPIGPPYHHEDGGACATQVELTEQAVPPVIGEFLSGLTTFEASNLTELDAGSAADQDLADALRAATAQYYQQIDPCDRRETLTEFRDVNGFDGTEAHASFANSVDLGFGRDMYCKQNGLDVACYVTNYGTVGDEPSNDQAEANEALNGFLGGTLSGTPAPFATVAMEYSQIETACGDPPSFGDPERVVKFYVYNTDGSDTLVSANLDGQGQRPIPQLCMVCHSGAYPGGPTTGAPVFASRDDVKLGSRFLPFDLAGFTYPNLPDEDGDGEPDFSKNNQQAAFHQLNEIVLASNPGDAITEMINALYPGGTPPQDEDAVVTGWSAPAAQEDMYKNVVARTCRTCHVASVFEDSAPGVEDGLEFDHADDLIDARLGQAEIRVCTEGTMPHAARTHQLFWTSTGPSMAAQFQAFGDAFGNATNGWNGTRCGVYTEGGEDFLTFFQEHVELAIFEGVSSGTSACTGCHIGTPGPGNGNLILTQGDSHAQLVNVPSFRDGVAIDRVEPNSLDDSFLWHKVRGSQEDVAGPGADAPPGGDTMPLGGAQLDQTPHIDNIEAWINAGASE